MSGARITAVEKPTAARDDVIRFLSTYHGAPVDQLEELPGGFWSRAYGYRVDGRELVLRLGRDADGFASDRAAMRFAGHDLPVPEILDVGEALGHSFAMSVRHHGRFLEDISVDEAEAVGPPLVGLLDALRKAPVRTAGPPAEADPFEPADGWRGWLTTALSDDTSSRTAGWRAGLAEDARAERVFAACETRIGDLLEACPERRDLVHSDLLHQNVLVSGDGTEVTGVFSWKCATLGDFLYDTAWCTFWGAWHPGIGAVDVWSRVTRPRPGLAEAGLVDAAQRHHCYELQIGASHLGWYVWTNDHESLRWCADRLDGILERGPLTR